MKKLFYIQDTLANKISFWHLAAFLSALPFDFFYSEIILISFAIHTIIHAGKSNYKAVLSREILIITSVYILGTLAILYSPDKQEGLSIATKQLAMLLIPVLFALTGLDLQKYTQALCLFFALTCTITVVYLFADAIHTILYFHLPVSSMLTLAFMNHNFSLPIEIHATYLSMYVAFSIIVIAFQLSSERNPRLKFAYTVCLLILSMGLLQLSSRAVFIGLLTVVNIGFPLLLFRGRRRLIFIIISLSLSAGLLFAITRIDSFKERYITELKKDLAHKVALVEINEPRMARWEVIGELIKRSPLAGYGTGSEKGMLKEKYFEKKLYSSYLNEFNSHSEYLSMLLKMGVIGLLLFLYVLYAGFAAAWKRRNLLFMGFLTLVSIVCVSENLLDLNKGIFFYSFFFSLFFIGGKRAWQADFNSNSGNPAGI